MPPVEAAPIEVRVMVLLLTFLAIEALLVLNIAMFIDGRREVPSAWIRSDVLLAIVANVAVVLLIFGIAGLTATLIEWWRHGVQVAYPFLIALSVVVTWWVMRTLSVRLRRLSAAAMARAAATMPQAAVIGIPPTGTPGNGAVAG